MYISIYTQYTIYIYYIITCINITYIYMYVYTYIIIYTIGSLVYILPTNKFLPSVWGFLA